MRGQPSAICYLPKKQKNKKTMHWRAFSPSPIPKLVSHFLGFFAFFFPWYPSPSKTQPKPSHPECLYIILFFFLVWGRGGRQIFWDFVDLLPVSFGNKGRLCGHTVMCCSHRANLTQRKTHSHLQNALPQDNGRYWFKYVATPKKKHTWESKIHVQFTAEYFDRKHKIAVEKFRSFSFQAEYWYIFFCAAKINWYWNCISLKSAKTLF